MRYRIAENEYNLRSKPWRDAIGIEDMIDPDLAVPPIVAWLMRGDEQAEFAAFLIRALNSAQ